MRVFFPFLSAGAMLLLASCAARAGGIDNLKDFVRETHSAQARFTQTVLDRQGKTLQRASGVMRFSRPGKFRWDYEKPYEQLIVGDGEKLWVYDRDLAQVTVKKLDQAIGGSPAALLAGDNEIEQNFALRAAEARGGLEWLEAVPKTQDSAFEKVRLGFRGAAIEAMELRDHFGQTTVLRFSGLERNPELPAELFRFVPPKDADVVSE